MTLKSWRKLEHGPVVSQVEHMLRERLQTGDWSAGDQLPAESVLATEIGVGRSSVREAVRLLEREGLLEVRHGSGTFVANAEPTEHAVGQLLRRARILEVYEVRRSLEVEAARLAAARAHDEDLADLWRQLRDRASLAHDTASFVRVDLDFHAAVVALSGNSVLVALFAFARPIIEAALVDRITHEGALPDKDDAHEALVSALERHDVAGAVAATVANLDDTMRRLRAEETDHHR